MMIEVRMESGIDRQTMSVLRQLPRNSRIIIAVRKAAISASRTTPDTDARTNSRLIEELRDAETGGKCGGNLGQQLLHSIHHRERGGASVPQDRK